MLRRITISGYRSLFHADLRVERLTVMSGANGVGKTNFYNALRLLSMAARGRLAVAIVEEGGMPSAMWAGPTKAGPRRIEIQVEFDDFAYRLVAGLPKPPVGDNIGPDHPGWSMFQLDPLVRVEQVWAGNPHRGGVCTMQRKAGALFIRNDAGAMEAYSGNLDDSESALPQLRDPQRFPELFLLRERLAQWRFYHQFDSSSRAPQRWPQVATRTPILADDGRDLAAAFRTIEEIGDGKALHGVLQAAFPGNQFKIMDTGGSRLGIQMSGEVERPFAANEFSDGTLRFLCLAVALLSPRPPEFLVLNEPEASLHSKLLPNLIELVRLAKQKSQIWITTHNSEFARSLANQSKSAQIELVMMKGKTSIKGAKSFDAMDDESSRR